MAVPVGLAPTTFDARKSCQKHDLKVLMVYQTAGQVQTSCIIQIQTADMGYLSLAPSA